jgi:Tfp pilus assembly protein PilV
MTLIEVLVALVILVGPLLAVAGLSGKLAHAVGESGARNKASQLAMSRLEEVKGATRYADLGALYSGTEYAVPGTPGFRRETFVKRVVGSTQAPVDYTIVTVEVSAAGLKSPIRKTTVVSGF